MLVTQHSDYNGSHRIVYFKIMSCLICELFHNKIFEIEENNIAKKMV